VNPIVSKLLSGTAYSSYPVPTITAVVNPSYPINSGTTPILSRLRNRLLSCLDRLCEWNSANHYVQHQHIFKLQSQSLSTECDGKLPCHRQNQTPGGGASASYPLIAYISIPLTASALTADPIAVCFMPQFLRAPHRIRTP